MYCMTESKTGFKVILFSSSFFVVLCLFFFSHFFIELSLKSELYSCTQQAYSDNILVEGQGDILRVKHVVGFGKG